ncbi:o-succinylbenzoate synthase [Bacillus piscicola]|uniref:o-succinylbenzoate synthase n=1 Tax=Bacillus piscicola TaxID=1632684 RepID=UPI001F090204|nr:o-succinylbenzoate synthase [Bacillus piscicola]
MNIREIHLRVIQAPLKKPFVTHLETVRKREAIIVEAIDVEGRCGYGEAVPFSSPWYTEETIQTCWHMLNDFLIPLTFKTTWHHPEELPRVWKGIRRNHMAKSALEQALWDLYAKQQEVYLGDLFGGHRKEITTGAVIAATSMNEALSQIEEYEKTGYERYKIKIHPENDLELLSAIRSSFPELPLMADANGAYTLDMAEHLKQFDAFQLLMIEQPLSHFDIVEHAELQRHLETPICLDESIHSVHDVKSAIMLGSCQIFTLKMAKIGGWSAAAAIHEFCLQHDVPLWVGGMIEFGVSRAHNVALATLSGFTLPGDISASSKYWETDIIEPEITVNNGRISVPDEPGIGFAINDKSLRDLTEYQQTYKKRHY